ncbi:MAG: hypothetical protein WD180_04250, partial [Pseudohongiellaceae bacterium]
MPYIKIHRSRRTRSCSLIAAIGLCVSGLASADFPGGFVEQPSYASDRPLLSQSRIQNMLPSRGKFTFPSPYNTEGVRITNGSDCGGSDCVNYVGYSYWRNMNNHVGQDTMLIFLGLDRSRGGSGPTLFEYNKVTDQVRNLGPLFNSSTSYSYASGEGWYFSATKPTKLYMNNGPRILRYDVITGAFETVFDVSSRLNNVYLHQMHSSSDDRVHSATVRASGGGSQGCMVYFEDNKQFKFFPRKGDYDECQVDKSGDWLV